MSGRGRWASKLPGGRPTGIVDQKPTPAQAAIAKAARLARAEGIRRLFLASLAFRGVSRPLSELAFDPNRRWRLDYAFPAVRLAVEQEGIGGRHQRTAGFLKDMEKYNALTLAGWSLLRFTTKQMRSGEAAEAIAKFCAMVNR